MKTKTTTAQIGFRYWYDRLNQIKGEAIVWVIQLLHNMRKYEALKRDLEQMEAGTIGKAIADTLTEKGYDIIPGFESHDLKHVLLGYSMTAEDEVRMQAFLLGNGNFSPVCFMFLSLGFLMPETWPSLITAYKRGRRTPCILHLTIENAAHLNLEELKRVYKIDDEARKGQESGVKGHGRHL